MKATIKIETELFTSDEKADILNAINEAIENMGYVAVGYDDTNGVWMNVMIQRN